MTDSTSYILFLIFFSYMKYVIQIVLLNYQRINMWWIFKAVFIYCAKLKLCLCYSFLIEMCEILLFTSWLLLEAVTSKNVIFNDFCCIRSVYFVIHYMDVWQRKQVLFHAVTKFWWNLNFLILQCLLFNDVSVTILWYGSCCKLCQNYIVLNINVLNMK
jgi:hypothetical protein